MEGLDRWEAQLGRPIEFVSIYQAWESPYNKFYSNELCQIHRSGRTPLVTWEPWRLPALSKAAQDQPAFALRQILAGRYNKYIYDWARASKSLEMPYLLRPMHEMNGNWYPWSGTVNGNRPEEYVQTWRYLHDVFSDAGATQVAWVWCPYVFSFPASERNAISRYYPGDSYVDWLALDGYNWGDSQPWSSWKNFDEIFGSGYKTVTGLSDKPLLIAETASTEIGGSKSEWIESSFRTLRDAYPRVKVLVWFNVQKECDWQIDSSEAALVAFKQGISNYLQREDAA